MDPTTPTPEQPPSEVAETAAQIAGTSTAPPEAPPTPPAQTGTSDAPSFETPFNINEVPEDQRPYVEAYNKQLQGAFTRKAMEFAEQRKQLDPVKALHDRLHADDQATRDAAVREVLQLAGWEDQSTIEEPPTPATQAPPADPQVAASQPPPSVPPEVQAQLDELRNWKVAQEQRDQERRQEAYQEAFVTSYVDAADKWAARNGYENFEDVPEHVARQLQGYVRGIPLLTDEQGRRMPDMENALRLLDADRAAYLTSKDAPAPNTGAVTAQTAPNPSDMRDAAKRRAKSLEIAGRHL